MGEEPIRCPYCGSGHVQGGKKGFSAGRALAGDLLVGPLGLLAGAVGGNRVQLICLSCGKQWEPSEVAGIVAAQRRRAQGLGRYKPVVWGFLGFAALCALLGAMAGGGGPPVNYVPSLASAAPVASIPTVSVDQLPKAKPAKARPRAAAAPLPTFDPTPAPAPAATTIDDAIREAVAKDTKKKSVAAAAAEE